jgi:L-ascorbate metabolism protein UlaG (beta-lactamase superfamily)
VRRHGKFESPAQRGAKLLKPKAVVPIHYNTWDLIKVDPQLFAQLAEDLGVQPHVLGAGESIEL